MAHSKDALVQMSSEWIKVIAESNGVSTTAEESAYKFVAEDVSFRLKSILQDAVKLSQHAKRTKLTTHDIDFTLKMRHYEPLYGFTSSDYIPFRNASGGGREVHFTEDKEIDLDELAKKQLPKVPLNSSLKAHWLAIEGVQPAIPENPPPVSRELQKLEGINPVTKASIDKLGKSRLNVKKGVKDIKFKPLTEHDLSVEQQLYYKEITEACVGADEVRRTEALTSLAQDPGLHKMLPRLCTFISEGVRINCVNSNLAILIYLMRMLKALLDNSSLYLEKYLHELIPSAVTCVVSKQLCVKPDSDNHWALRDFASKILGQLCRKFNSITNDIQTRVVKILSEALHTPRAPLSTHYGAIMALAELGPGVVQSFIVPIVKVEGERIRAMSEETSINAGDKIAAQHIKNAFIKTLAPTLKTLRKPPDVVESYLQDFGYLGSYIHEAVSRQRAQTPSTAPSLIYASGTTSRHTPGSALPRSVGGLTLLNPHSASAVNRSYSMPSGGRGALPSPIIRMSGGAVGGPGTSLVRTPSAPNTPGSGTSSQRFIIMSSSASSSLQSAPSPTVVKVVNPSSSGGLTPASQLSINKALSLQSQPHSAGAGDQSVNVLVTPKVERS